MSERERDGRSSKNQPGYIDTRERDRGRQRGRSSGYQSRHVGV